MHIKQNKTHLDKNNSSYSDATSVLTRFKRLTYSFTCEVHMFSKRV